MGILDDLKKLWDDAGDKAKKEAGKAAARQAAGAVKDKIADVGDEFLGTAEKELQAAQKAREGRADYGPGDSDADDIADAIQARARQLEEEAKARRRGAAPPPADDSEEGLIGTDRDDAKDDAQARARKELERLKAARDARRGGGDPDKTL